MIIRGERHYLWRAIDQDGDVIDILVQRYRNAHAGIVNLSRCQPDFADENEYEWLPRLPVPPRDRQPRRLVVPSILPELPRC